MGSSNSKPHQFSDQQIQEKFPSQKCKPILNNTSVKEPSEKVQHDFLFATIEKAVK